MLIRGNNFQFIGLTYYQNTRGSLLFELIVSMSEVRLPVDTCTLLVLKRRSFLFVIGIFNSVEPFRFD